MSGNQDEEKDTQKVLPLDLARSQITNVRNADSTKVPLVVTNPALRSVRVLAQGNSNSVSVGQTIITNLVPGAVIKQDRGTHLTNIVGGQPQNPPPQRPAQITISATPLVANPNSTGTSYHVPRGPAVVANLAAPRSNVTTVRTPLVVAAQNNPTHTFVRPARTPSPAQSTAWLTTNNSNGSQIKCAPTVLSAPVRGATVTNKATRPQLSQPMSTIRPGTLLTNAITIGQTQVHSFKPASGAVHLPNAVTFAQMLPARTQAVVYSANTSAQFTPTARITVTPTTQASNVRPPHTRPIPGSIVNTTRLTVPVQSTRMLVPSTNQQQQRIPPANQPVLSTATRLVSTQSSGTVVGRLAVNSTSAANPSNILTTQARISTLSTLNLQSLMAVANGAPARVQQATQGAKMITQSTGAAIHITQIPSQLKTNNSAPGTVVTTAARTINVPASIVTQRAMTPGGPAQAISIAKVFTPTSTETNVGGAASVLIHAPLHTAPPQRHPSPSAVVSQSSTVYPPAAVPGHESTTGFFYDNRSPPQFVNAQVRPPSNQHRFGAVQQVMVVDQGRVPPSAPSAQFQAEVVEQTPKVTSSPRPSILRKRDHEGSPLKAAKNLSQVLGVQVPPSPASPPSPPRPDSGGHSSGGSTTISATSSPGLPEGNDDSNPPGSVMKETNTMREDEEDVGDLKPAQVEVTPRKKPRKQQLTGNDIDENHDDMQFISESTNNAVTKKGSYDSEGVGGHHSDTGGKDECSRVLKKPATASLLSAYRQTWKATHNHFRMYSDVKPKEERRPTIIDLANQNRILDKVNGWKIYHLSTQMEDLAEQEQSVYDQLTDLLKFTESEENSRDSNDKELNRVNELIKGNLQRIKIINDGMLDAKSQIMKVFEHQRHVNDILSRCVSKRSFKKREKT